MNAAEFLAVSVDRTKVQLEVVGAKAVEHHQAMLRRKAAETVYRDAWRDFQEYVTSGERIKRGHDLFEDAIGATKDQFAAFKRAAADERNAAARLARAAGKVHFGDA